MAIQVQWHNPERTIILQKREPGWTWEDFDAVVDQYVALAQSVTHKVALIVDCLNAPNAPSASALDHYRRADSLKPENLVLMVIVSVGGFLEIMGKVYTSAKHEHEFLQFVRSMEEAEALCNEVLASPASDAALPGG